MAKGKGEGQTNKYENKSIFCGNNKKRSLAKGFKFNSPPFADDGPHEAVQQLLVGRVLHLRLHYLPSGAAAADLDDLGGTAQPVVLADGHHAHLRLRGRDERDLSAVDVVVGVPAAVQHDLRGRDRARTIEEQKKIKLVY